MILNRHLCKIYYIDNSYYIKEPRLTELGSACYTGSSVYGLYTSALQPAKTDALFLESEKELYSYFNRVNKDIDSIKKIYFFPDCTYPKARLLEGWKRTIKIENSDIQVFSKLKFKKFRSDKDFKVLYSEEENSYYILDWSLRKLGDVQTHIDLELLPHDVTLFYQGQYLAFDDKNTEILMNLDKAEQCCYITDFCKMIDHKFIVPDENEIERLTEMLCSNDIDIRTIAINMTASLSIYSIICRLGFIMQKRNLKERVKCYSMIEFFNTVFKFTVDNKVFLTNAYENSTNEDDKKFAIEQAKELMVHPLSFLETEFEKLKPIFKNLKVYIDDEVYSDTRV